MAFPSEAELKKMRKKLSHLEGTLSLNENPTPLELFRFELCQKFIKYLYKHDLSQKELAQKLGIDQPKMSKILHHRIGEFSSDRLIDLYSRLDPHFKLRVG